jgi:predicted RND superfamily exporter protein
MAMSGIVLRCATSVIFSIGFVIAIDDTIHFVGRFRLERSGGLTPVESAGITLRETGRAILLTSFVLFFGFIQLITSSFRDAQAIGILVSVMLVFALLADLFLGPLLLLWKREVRD